MFLVGLVAVGVRYRAGDDQLRRQLQWLLLALVLVVVALAVWGPLAPGLAVLNLLSIALVPIAMTVAVLRYQLLDIQLVLSRTLLYVAAQRAGDRRVPRAGRGRRCAAARRHRTDRAGRSDHAGHRARPSIRCGCGCNARVDRALYGDRSDPVRAVSRLGSRWPWATWPTCSRRSSTHCACRTRRFGWAAVDRGQRAVEQRAACARSGAPRPSH